MIKIVLSLLVAVGLIAAVPASYADIITYRADLDGPSEEPPNASTGTGFAEVIVNTDAHIITVYVTFSGLVGTTTAAHIHGPTAAPLSGNAGVMTTTPWFPGFPLGVTSGIYDSTTFDLTDASFYNPAFVTAMGGVAGAEAALLASLAENKAYFNIHTSFFPSGEIRGFLALAVPEPGTLALLGLGLAGLAALRRPKFTVPRNAGCEFGECTGRP